MENKQSAEEVIHGYHEFISEIYGELYSKNTVLECMQEYANQQNQELQKQVEELKRKLKQEVHNTDMVLEEYTKLKEAADKLLPMAEHMAYKSLDQIDSINNYKQLTTKP